ncbi:MAG TPA: DMT family transporter [Streptosporangiaceae bacterium]|nr:DMT family transporter [Streptosporangiaceae bacterium]
MSVTAVSLIAVAAVAHASWNLFSKQAAAAGTIAFVWMLTAFGTVSYLPALGIDLAVTHPHLRSLALVFLGGTALLHIGYFLTLQHGYTSGDLSLVYPVSRGSGLLLSSFVAIPLYAEHPGPAGIAGILLISGGVIVLSLPDRAAMPRATAITFGLLTGTFIAGYTLWDKYAVSSLHIPPLLEEWAAGAGVAIVLAPLAVTNTGRLALLWRDYRGQVLGAAILSPLAYILVLTALAFSPVSSIAPAREISVLIGVLLGRRLLGERNLGRRLGAALAITAGVAAIIAG